MKENLEKAWKKVEMMIYKRFGEKLDEQTILFIIGLQELGKKPTQLKKEEKLDIIHIGICTVLSPYGYYKLLGKDDDGWPHFKNVKKIASDFKGKAQEELLKKAIIDYFNL